MNNTSEHLQNLENHKHLLELQHQINEIDSKLDTIIELLDDLKYRAQQIESME